MSRRRDDPAVRGWIALDKPPGPTSHDMVARVRRSLGVRRVGHAGTLDPFASGLLLCLAGNATRLVPFVHRWPKTYVGTIVLGAESPTDDADGLVGPPPGPVPLPPPDLLATAVDRLTGRILQQPPAFSAKKIGGERAHRLARRGFAPDLAPVPVTVHRLRVLPARQPGRLVFAARVSSGTYLRSLARDLGRLLGTGAYLETLRRTAIGPLRVERALPAGDLPREPGEGRRLLRPVEELPLPLPEVRLGPGEAGRFRAGNPVPVPPAADPVPPDEPARVLDSAGLLIGIGVGVPGGMVRPRAVLAPPP